MKKSFVHFNTKCQKQYKMFPYNSQYCGKTKLKGVIRGVKKPENIEFDLNKSPDCQRLSVMLDCSFSNC